MAGALNGFISHAATDFVGGARLDVASAFFNVGGYALLADSLDQATGVRLLLGAEPAAPERRPRALGVESLSVERASDGSGCGARWRAISGIWHRSGICWGSRRRLTRMCAGS